MLRSKILVMIVGPSAIGKSTLMNEVVAQDDDFSYVRSFTTRSKRPGEQSHYDFIDREVALHLRDSGEATTFFEHPTTGDMYGTTTASFPTRYNLLDTLSISVAGYRELPFEHTVTISLTATPEQWREWFLSRYPVENTEATKRLEEATLSIDWSLHDPETYWIENPADKIPETATKLIDLVKNRPQATSTPDAPRAMLELIERGLWHRK